MNVKNLSILNNTSANDGTSMQYKGFWNFKTTDFSLYYLHMKTNINTVNNMWMIEAIGYNYCEATKIRSAWTFHNSGTTVYNISYTYLGGSRGLSPSNVYRSSDGYIVIVGWSPCWGYSGFMLNGYNTADGYNQASLSPDKSPQIIASAFSASNSGVY